MINIVFLGLGILSVPFLNPNAVADAQLSNTMSFVYQFISFCIYVAPVRIFVKYRKMPDKKNRALLILVATFIAYDLFSLLFIQIAPLTYAVQLVVLGLAFLCQKVIDKRGIQKRKSKEVL